MSAQKNLRQNLLRYGPHAAFRGMFFVFVLLISLITLSIKYYNLSNAAPAAYINFQARLLQGSGAIVPDGTYDIEFNLYENSTGGSSLWTEDHSVTVKAGYLSVYLGSDQAFPVLDWSDDKYLTMNVEGDGEMTPRLLLTAVPYAFAAGNSAQLGGVNAANYARRDAANTFTGAPNSFTPNNGTAIFQNSTAANGLLELTTANTRRALTVKTGSSTNLTIWGTGGIESMGAAIFGDYLQVSGTTNASSFAGSLGVGTATPTTAKLVVKSTTSNSSSAALNVTNSSDSSLLYVRSDGNIGVGTTSPGSYRLNVQGGDANFSNDVDIGGALAVSGGLTVGTVDATGTLLVLDTKNTAGDPTGVNGGMYYNSDSGKFRCYQNSTWVDCISAAGSGVTSLNSETGAVTIQGTTDQITVNTSSGILTLSTPQDINTTSSVTFASLQVTGNGEVDGNLTVDGFLKLNSFGLVVGGEDYLCINGTWEVSICDPPEPFSSMSSYNMDGPMTSLMQDADRSSGLQNGDHASLASLNVSGPTILSSLTVNGSATFTGIVTVEELIVNTNLVVGGQIISRGEAPEIALGSLLLNSEGSQANDYAQVEISGTDTAGTVKVMTGTELNLTDAEEYEIARITFSEAYAQPPRIVITAKNSSSATTGAFVELIEGGFVIKTVGKLMTSTDYEYDYIIVSSSTVASQ